LTLMFNGPKPDKKPEARRARLARPAIATTAQTGAARISMDDKDGLARLLFSLGRVTVQR
jgi:hypothetical protein